MLLRVTAIKKTSIYITEDRQSRQHAVYTQSTKKKFVQYTLGPSFWIDQWIQCSANKGNPKALIPTVRITK
jgi:hypothetical protein